MEEGTINLIDDSRATVALLNNPDWRIRAVEEIAVDAAATCLRRRSLQVAPLRSFLGSSLPEDCAHALVALYVAPMRRGPLVDFDVSGPDGDGWLLPRLEIAERQALYLEGVAAACGHTIDGRVHTLLSAICGFTGELLSSPRKNVKLQDYLQDGLGRPVGDAAVRKWCDIGDSCRGILRPRLDEFLGYSAPENPAIVLPGLFAAGDLSSDDEATQLLEAYLDLLSALDIQATQQSATPEDNLAEEFLVALADYANSYDLLVAMRVPLDEPFLVKFAERRDLRLSLFANRGAQELVVADAQTNHVTFKVPDPNVRIRGFEARRPGSDDYSFGAFQSRKDSQSRAFYAHDPDRDYRIRLSFKLGLLRRLQFVPYLVSGLLAVLVVALLVEQPTDLRTLALTVGPAALAASVLLAREPSTLGSQLRLVSSLSLAGALIVLVAVSASFYVSGLRADQVIEDAPVKIRNPQTPAPRSQPSSGSSPQRSPTSRLTPTRGPVPEASVTPNK